MTTISRDRIQFESHGDLVGDGNEQLHRDAAARAWEAAASDYLSAHGGGSASVRFGVDRTRFAVSGDMAIAQAADECGMAAAQAYIDEQVARVANF